MNTFTLRSPTGDVLDIPANLLSNHYVTESIQIYCPWPMRNIPIILHPDAFNSSKPFARRFVFLNCDFSRTDFAFLKGFARLHLFRIGFSYVHLQTWATLPLLPSLSALEIFQDVSKKVNELSGSNFPKLWSGLEKLGLEYCQISDEGMERILDWALVLSGKTLRALHITGNYLTRIPKQITYFTELHTLQMNNQVITNSTSGIGIITANSLNFIKPPKYVRLDNCSINSIEARAFQGKLAC